MKCIWLSRIAGLSMCWVTATAFAIRSGSEPPPPPPGHRDYYAEGLMAVEKEDWQLALELLHKLVEQRPWHDDGHNLLGFAYRQQGHFDQALAHYDKALELNPYHRGALEYRGETLLIMGKFEPALEMLERLADACRRVSRSTVNVAGCPQWAQLKQAIERRQARAMDTHESHTSWSKSNGAIDTTTYQLSIKQNFRAAYQSKVNPIPLNRMHSWVLRLQTADGQPLERAAIAVDGGMPEHDHGLPSAPRVTRYLGDGNYLIEGLKFHMNGWWQVKFRLKTEEYTDEVMFNLAL